MDVEIDCLANSAWVLFNQSAGAEDYVVTATYGHGALQTFLCNSSSEGQCSLPPLECSRNITVTLKALDQQCSSAASNAVTAETGKVEQVKVPTGSLSGSKILIFLILKSEQTKDHCVLP